MGDFVDLTNRRLLRRHADVRPDYRRGLPRLGWGLVMLWFVFWTFAYVLYSRAAENQVEPPAFTLSTDLALAAALILMGPWVVGGFRPE